MSTHPARKGISQSSCCWTRFRNCSCSRWFIRHRKRAMCGRSRNKCPFLRDPFTSARIFRWLRERSSEVRLAKTGKLSRSPESSCPRGHSTQIRNSAALQHLPYALLNLQLARKNSDSVIPNGVCRSEESLFSWVSGMSVIFLAAGNRWHNRNFGPGRNRCSQSAQVTHVLVAHKDINVLPRFARFGQNPITQSRVRNK